MNSYERFKEMQMKDAEIKEEYERLQSNQDDCDIMNIVLVSNISFKVHAELCMAGIIQDLIPEKIYKETCLNALAVLEEHIETCRKYPQGLDLTVCDILNVLRYLLKTM